MTVQELINRLQELDPSKPIKFTVGMESGMSFSSGETEECELDEDVEEGIYILYVEVEETDCQ